jgi:hypothetical protein
VVPDESNRMMFSLDEESKNIILLAGNYFYC